MKILVVVPARKNSKGIVGKNTAMCAGRPLVEWTLDLLPHLDLPDFYSVVSTDCPAVAACAERKGVPVLKRPDHLATDDATTLAVLQHSVTESGYDAQAVLLLQPTNPLRTVQDVSAAYRIMAQDEACDSVVSYVCLDGREPELMNATVCEGGHVHYDLSRDRRASFMRRQDFKKSSWRRTGEIYLTKRRTIERGSMVGESQKAYIIPRSRAWNIDEPCDIPIVEALLKFNGRV